MSDRLEVGDQLASRPCHVTVLVIDGMIAIVECEACPGLPRHVLDVPLFESGDGPWRRED